MPRHPQEIFKDTQASKLGYVPMHPLLHQQLSVHLSQHYIFITSHVMCFAWSVSLQFFVLFCFLVIIIWVLACLMWERYTLHFCLEYSYASLIIVEYSIFSFQLVLIMFNSYFSCLSCLRDVIRISITLLSFTLIYLESWPLWHQLLYLTLSR